MTEISGTPPAGSMSPMEYAQMTMQIANTLNGSYGNGNQETLEGLNTMLFGPKSPDIEAVGAGYGKSTPTKGARKGGGLVDKSVAEIHKIMAADPKEEQKTLQQYYKTAQKMYDTQRAETEAKTMAMQQDALQRARDFDMANQALMQATVGNIAHGGQMQQLQRPPAYSGDLLSGEKAIADMGMKGAEAGMANQQEMVKMMEIAKRADAANRVAMFNTTMSAAANIAGKGAGQQKAVEKAVDNAMKAMAPKIYDPAKISAEQRKERESWDKRVNDFMKEGVGAPLQSDLTETTDMGQKVVVARKGSVVPRTTAKNLSTDEYNAFYDGLEGIESDYLTNHIGNAKFTKPIKVNGKIVEVATPEDILKRAIPNAAKFAINKATEYNDSQDKLDTILSNTKMDMFPKIGNKLTPVSDDKVYSAALKKLKEEIPQLDYLWNDVHIQRLVEAKVKRMYNKGEIKKLGGDW